MRQVLKIGLVLASVLMPYFGITPAIAQQAGSDFRVSEIRIEGSQRIEAETVRSYMSFHRGDVVSPAALDKSLKSLFVTGLFADVILRR